MVSNKLKATELACDCPPNTNLVPRPSMPRFNLAAMEKRQGVMPGNLITCVTRG